MLPETEYLESESQTIRIRDEINRIVNQAKASAHVDTGALKKSIFGIIGSSIYVKRVKKKELCEFEMLFYGVYEDNSKLVELVPTKIFGHDTIIYFVTEFGERMDMTKSDRILAKPQGQIRTAEPQRLFRKTPKVSTVPTISKQKDKGFTKIDFTNMLNVFKNRKNESNLKP